MLPRIATLRRSARARAARLALAPVLLAALAGCEGSTFEPVDDGPSTFRYSFVARGTEVRVDGGYEVAGDPQPGTPSLGYTFAAGQRHRRQGALQLVSNWRTPTGHADNLALTVTRTTPGTAEVQPGCGGELCTGIVLRLRLSPTTASGAHYTCVAETGAVRILEISRTRVRGSFSGTGRCAGSPGRESLDDFRIMDGEFNVKLADARI